MLENLKGCGTALVTPFRPDGRVDEEALASLVEWQVQAGIHFLVPCGTTGESVTLDHDEYLAVVRITVETAASRVPVVAGAGGNNTAKITGMIAELEKLGVDAILSVSPYYNKPTQEGVYQHYKAIADAARFPLILYNIPSRTGMKVEATTIARLAELGYVVGLKEATGSLDEVQEVVRLTDGRMDVYSGDDSLTLPVIAVGGKGVISVVANVLPKQSADVVQAALSGDYATARRLHFEMLPLIRALFLETNPIPVKAALAMMGYCRDELRLPLVPMTEAARAKLRTVMQTYGLL